VSYKETIRNLSFQQENKLLIQEKNRK